MGQATVDLPDPMQPPHSAAGTDELLAQLAGEEIDRLLTEADAERPAATKPDEAAPPEFDSPAQGAISPGVQEQATAAAAAADAELSAQLDNLFADLTTATPSAELASAPPQNPAVPAGGVATTDDLVGRATLVPLKATLSSSPADSASAASDADAPVHPVEEELRATEALERAGRATARAEAQGQTPPASAAPQDAALAMLAEASPPLPLYLRPLEWISAPLDAFPESVRDVIGKVAILTAVNAISVLIYVLLFRRH